MLYPIAILLAAIVALLTVKWGGIPDLARYITFGLTLTSLVLSLIAIIYAIISNTNISQHLGMLRSAGKSVAETTASLTRISDSLESKLAEIPGLIKDVRVEVKETHKEVMEGINKAPLAASTDKTPMENNTTINVNDLVKSFLGTSSFDGLIVLYTCQLALKSSKPFNINQVWKNTKINPDYAYGFLVAASSAKMVKYSEKDNMLNVTELAPSTPNLREFIESTFKSPRGNPPSTWSIEREIETNVMPVEAYFKD
jgi:hypothetical protein